VKTTTKKDDAPLLGVPDALDRADAVARAAGIAREACAGTRIIEAAARDFAGLGWSFHPYAPTSGAARSGEGWAGHFEVCSRRLVVRVDVERHPDEARVAELEAEVTEAKLGLEAVEEEEREARERIAELEEKLSAYTAVVEAALLGEGGEAIRTAEAIPAKLRP
jgi:hypothetical protein